MPVSVKGSQGRGKASQLELLAVVDWYFTENYERLELERARTRLANEQADKTRMENDVRSQDLAEVSVIAAVVDDLASNVKTNLLAMARKIAPELEGMNVQQREATIERSVRESLEELSAYRPRRAAPKSDRSSDARPLEAAAHADGERVGGRIPNSQPRGKRRARKVANRKG